MPVVSAFLVHGNPLPFLKPKNPPWVTLDAGYRAAAASLAASKPDVIAVFSTQWIAVLDELWQTRPRSRGLHVDENWHAYGDLPFDIRADVELTQCSGTKFEFRMDDGDIRMDEGKGSLQITGDDSDVEIKNGNFTSLDAKIDDGDLILETSLADNGVYSIDAQDGLIFLVITKGGGKFDIRHDDGRVATEGDFSTLEKSDDMTKLSLANGNATVNIRADDARIRLIKK